MRDYFSGDGYPVITFASILKFNEFPLGEILARLLEIGEVGIGCPVEIEFAINLQESGNPHFYLLQIRPMAVAQNKINVKITAKDMEKARCFSDMTMGQSQESSIENIIYVKPDCFDPAKNTGNRKGDRDS